MPSNTAAFLVGPKLPLEVRPAPYHSPEDDEILVKNCALAINPADPIVQMTGADFFQLNYPDVIGEDVAGEVCEVGSKVTRFKTGDRVVGMGLWLGRPGYKGAAFQEYTVLKQTMAAPIPASMSYESAVVLPLGMCSSGGGLFGEDYLALEHPSLTPKPTGKTLLVYSGSSSVGSNAIQLALAAGYEVIATASPKNFDYCKKLGASQVFDYNSSTIAEDLIAAFKGKTSAGAIAIGSIHAEANGASAAEVCLRVVQESEGDKFVAMAMSFPEEMIPEGVSAKYIMEDVHSSGVGKMLFGDFLPEALAQNKYKAAPEPLVVGKGLENVQAGFDALMKGVSAKKIVVTL